MLDCMLAVFIQPRSLHLLVTKNNSAQKNFLLRKYCFFKMAKACLCFLCLCNICHCHMTEVRDAMFCFVVNRIWHVYPSYILHSPTLTSELICSTHCILKLREAVKKTGYFYFMTLIKIQIHTTHKNSKGKNECTLNKSFCCSRGIIFFHFTKTGLMIVVKPKAYLGSYFS